MEEATVDAVVLGPLRELRQDERAPRLRGIVQFNCLCDQRLAVFRLGPGTCPTCGRRVQVTSTDCQQATANTSPDSP